MAERDESPRAAARREVREELGLDVEIGRLLVLDWVPRGRRPDDGLMLLYGCNEVDASRFVLPSDELRSTRHSWNASTLPHPFRASVTEGTDRAQRFA